MLEVSSSPVHVPHIKYGFLDKESKSTAWNWLDVPSPTNECSGKVSIRCLFIVLVIYAYEDYLQSFTTVSLNFSLLQVKSLLSSLQFSIMKIPVTDVSDSLTKGITNQFHSHLLKND